MSIELKLLGKTSRVLRAWACCITLCLGVSACISPDLEPPRGSPGSSLPATPNTPQNGAKPSDGLVVGGTGGSAAAASPGMTTPPTTMVPAGAAAGRGATAPTTGSPQTPPGGGMAGAASEASDGDADAGVP